MKFFNALLIALMIPQLALAQGIPAGRSDYILKRTTLQLSERFVEEIVAQFNKQLKKPDAFLKKYNRDVAKIDKRLVLKKDDIKYLKAQKAGSSSLRLYYSKADYLAVDLRHLARGEISFNGKKILWEDARNPQKLYRFMKQQIFAAEGQSKKVSGLLSWLVSDAHAISGLLLSGITPALILIIAGFILLVHSVYANVKNDLLAQEHLERFKKNLEEAKAICIASHDMLVSGGQVKKANQDKIMGTLRFIGELEPFIAKKIDANIFSCSYIRENVVQKVKTFEVIPVYKIVGRVCELAAELEECLNKTKTLASRQGVNVDDSLRAGKDEASMIYQRILENMNPSGALQR